MANTLNWHEKAPLSAPERGRGRGSSPPIALVTGASGGIGREIAHHLARQGWKVFGASLILEAEEAGISSLLLDLTSPASIQACVENVLNQAGRIDVLVNNAGITGPAAASEEMSSNQARAIFEVNFFGTVALTNAVLPVMRRQGEGKILFVSSVGGLVAAMPYFTIYSASKHALEAYAAGLRLECQPFNIQVTSIEPGYTQTSALDHPQPPARPHPAYATQRQRILHLHQVGLRFGTPPSQVATAVLRAIQQDHPARNNLIGSDSAWMVHLNRFLPTAFFERLVYWIYYQWQSRSENGIPHPPRDLGLRWVLFHRPTRDRTIRAGFMGALILALGLLKTFQNKQNRNRSYPPIISSDSS